MHCGMRFVTALAALCFGSALADQAQFCRDGVADGKPDFCMAVFLYHNHTTSSHDLYLTLETRHLASPTPRYGWTAIGTGPSMSGALMFIMYGDPKNDAGDGPVLSVRTVDEGHTPPRPFAADKDAHGGVDVQVLNSSWVPSEDYYTGALTLVCYNCGSWHGNAVDTEATSQPWIYASNPDQDLGSYAADATLKGHGANGYGKFYVDMTSASTHHGGTVPEIDHSISEKGASDKEIKQHQPSLAEKIAARPIAYLHGFFMLTAFLILFPLGVLAIRSGLSAAFRYHWAIQGSAIVCALCGAGMGLAMSEGNIFGPLHQKIGITVSSLLVLQVVSGWWHHLKFVQIRRRTWVSYAHMSVGWTVLVGGWVNALIGLTLFGLGKLGMFLVFGFIAAEVIGLVGWVYVVRKWTKQASRAKENGAGVWEDGVGEEYFALHDDIDSDDGEELADRKPSQERPLRPSGDYRDDAK